jgi:hypothetical protein
MPFSQDRAGGSGVDMDSALTRRQGERDDVAGGGEIGARPDEIHSIAAATIREDEYLHGIV